jgi:hypothetical protein
VDGVASYPAGAVSSIQASVKMSTGTHTVIVRAWDTSGAYGDHTFSVTVKSLKPTVVVSTPANHANAGSPINIQATASPTAGQTISAWWIYVDGTGSYSAGPVSSINASVKMALGTHTVIVRAWDTSGGYGDTTLTLTASAKPSVALSTPAVGANVISPITIKASATASTGHSITGWCIYVDGSEMYNAGAVTSITANLAAATGTHTLVVRAWDSSGAYGDQTMAVEVAHVAVNVSSPANNASVTSPVDTFAAASSTNTITGWQIYVDTIPWYGQNSGDLLGANLAMSAGTHTVLVRAWDSTGAYGDQTIKVTVP